MTLEVREKAVAFEAETTYGTDVIADSIDNYFKVVGDAPIVAPQRVVVESEEVCATQDGIEHQSYTSHNDVTLTVYLRGKESTAGDAPLWAALLQASGAAETITASTSAAYTWETFHTPSNAPSMTIYEDVYYTNGNTRRFEATGVYGNLTLSAEMDNYATVAFTGMGLFTQAESSTSSRTAPSAYDGSKSALLCRAMTIEINSTAYNLRAFDLNTNWALEEDRNMSGSSSLDRVYLKRGSASRMGGSLEFADVDLFEQILTAYGTDAQYTFSAVWADGTDTVTLTFTLQFGQYTRSGGNLGSYSVPYFVVGTPTITFT